MYAEQIIIMSILTAVNISAVNITVNITVVNITAVNITVNNCQFKYIIIIISYQTYPIPYTRLISWGVKFRDIVAKPRVTKFTTNGN